MKLNRDTLRVAIGLVAAFYVIVGALFLLAYIPVARADAMIASGEASSAIYDQSSSAMSDVLNYDFNQARAARYGSWLLWGTVGLAVFGGVVVATRSRAQPPAED